VIVIPRVVQSWSAAARAESAARSVGLGPLFRCAGYADLGLEVLAAWLSVRASLPVGAVFCVLRGPMRGRPRSVAGVRVQLRQAAVRADVRRRFAPHSSHPRRRDVTGRRAPGRHTRQIGHADLGITSVCLRGIDNTEIIHTVHERSAHMIPATNGLVTLR
jgi:hypothetical protein